MLVLLVQATSAYSVKVQGWLKEEALEWGSKIDADLAAKEKDTQTVKQERQRDLIALKVCSLYHPSYTSTIKVWYFKVYHHSYACQLMLYSKAYTYRIRGFIYLARPDADHQTCE